MAGQGVGQGSQQGGVGNMEDSRQDKAGELQGHVTVESKAGVMTGYRVGQVRYLDREE